ncbi:hypothetical protein Acr_00g0089120 [Actinidia rufa]|uniref:Uncharacterized protein n=1 Tax=Actinidia rufa TaxID=165716 RepID=A0A7J0DZ10_9ERIC|nr:hypothetical protein Acr_00g0089120 [Actinidia rufa]
MTQDELDLLRESHSFPPSVQIRLPKEDKTIASTHSGEVGFYEADFHVGLCLPIHPTIRKILYYYNICPTQLILNAWRSLVYAVSTKINCLFCPLLSKRGFKGSWTQSQVRNPFTIKELLESRFFPMSRRISLKKLTQKVGESKGDSSAVKSTPTAEGVVIGEKCPREVSDTSPSKKGKLASISKDKGTASPSTNQKKATWKFIEPSSKEANKATSAMAVEEGSYGRVLLHQTWSIDERRATEELAKAKDERDATVDKLAKLEALVAKLRDKKACSKKLAVKKFKTSDDFQEAVEITAFKYFGEEFDFCKRQLCCHHPDLSIDLDGMGIDHDLLKEEEEEEKEDGN